MDVEKEKYHYTVIYMEMVMDCAMDCIDWNDWYLGDYEEYQGWMKNHPCLDVEGNSCYPF